MSGYLEVKYPIKSNLGLNPFKSWKRQWCILRPSVTFSGGVLAVYCSEAGAAAGSVELPSGFVVRRAKSRSRPHAFAVFPPDDPRKPRVLLAATSPHEAHIWMEKIKSLIAANNVLDTVLIKDSYSVTVVDTELSRRLGLHGCDGTISVTAAGLRLTTATKHAFCVEWKHIANVTLSNDRRPECIVTIDSMCPHSGGGCLQLSSPLAQALCAALVAGTRAPRYYQHPHRPRRAISRSEGDLCPNKDTEEIRRSWYSGPSEVSLDDLDLVMSKECSVLPRGKLARYGAALLAQNNPGSTASFDDSMSDRRSVASIASGIYEEIPDVPSDRPISVNRAVPVDRPVRSTTDDAVTSLAEEYCVMTRDRRGLIQLYEEPMYEAVGEGAYCTVRRRGAPAPPLPPRHGSLWTLTSPGAAAGATPGVAGAPPGANARTLPRWDRSRHAFTAFRKRLKSDSRAAVSPKSETSKDKDVETKKKKFDFTPTRDIFKSFKVSRKMKNLKITSSKLSKGETKSCEFLDEQEHVTTKRCSKSVECLESSDEFLDRIDADLSMRLIDHDDTVQALSLPKEIVELIIKEKILLNEQVEGDYMPMSPIVPTPPIEHHYIVMSPRTNIA